LNFKVLLFTLLYKALCSLKSYSQIQKPIVMTQTKNLQTTAIHSFPLGKLMLIGAGVGLIIISIFLMGVNQPRPEWGQYWMIRPLVIVPLAGAAGGVFYYIMDFLRYRGGWRTALAYFISVIGIIVGLWMGIVLGLVGTLWH
jgi:hypothetical protein